MKAEFRVFRELRDFDLGSDYRNLPQFADQARQMFEKTSALAWFMVQRNGRVVSVGLDPVSVVTQAARIPDHTGFTRFHLLCLHHETRETLDSREIRLLQAYQLDAVISVPLNLTHKANALLATLHIQDSCLTDQVDSKVQSVAQLQSWLRDRNLGLRDEEVEFSKKVAHTKAQVLRALAVEVTIRSRQISWYGSPADEFLSLAHTLGIEVSQHLAQSLDKPHPGTLLGSGKYQNLLDCINSSDLTHVLFNCDIPTTLKRRITQETFVTVWDRTDLILQIFLKHANSEKARLQVELASLQYHGDEEIRTAVENFDFDKGYDTYEQNMRLNLAKQKKELLQKIEKCHQQEATRHETRQQQKPLSLALIGYTNAGKSSLFNYLLQSEIVAAAPVLFKTLETTTRLCDFNDHSSVLLTDTVGFLQRMPGHLYEAFHSTLAQANLSTHLLILLDPVGIPVALQKECILESLAKIGRTDSDHWIYCMSKADLLTTEQRQELLQIDPELLFVSSIDPVGLQAFKEQVLGRITLAMEHATLVLDHADYGKIHQLRSFCTLLQDPVYTETGIELKIMYPKEQGYRIKSLFGEIP